MMSLDPLNTLNTLNPCPLAGIADCELHVLFCRPEIAVLVKNRREAIACNALAVFTLTIGLYHNTPHKLPPLIRPRCFPRVPLPLDSRLFDSKLELTFSETPYILIYTEFSHT